VTRVVGAPRGMACGRSTARGLALVGLALVALARPVRAQQVNGDSVLDRAVQAFQAVNTLRANFVQHIRDPMLGTDDTSRGEFLQQRPNKVAMRWRDPAGDLLVVDGQTLWVYLPSSTPGQVVRSDIQGRPGQSPDLVAEFLERPRERFTITYVKSEAVGARMADVLMFVPKQAGGPYRRVQIWVDRQDALPRQVEISEVSGAVRRLTFDRLRANAPIPASTFTFTPPRGVRVVDATR
jgi:outer membrane lipoprotein carrier protein